jgi:hypothetical protein
MLHKAQIDNGETQFFVGIRNLKLAPKPLYFIWDFSEPISRGVPIRNFNGASGAIVVASDLFGPQIRPRFALESRRYDNY